MEFKGGSTQKCAISLYWIFPILLQLHLFHVCSDLLEPSSHYSSPLFSARDHGPEEFSS